MIQFIVNLLVSNWETISAVLLAFIVRLLEKKKMKKQVEEKLKNDFPALANEIITAINKK